MYFTLFSKFVLLLNDTGMERQVANDITLVRDHLELPCS